LLAVAHLLEYNAPVRQTAGHNSSGAAGQNRQDKEVILAAETRPRSWYIVIEGAIGVGKTTLARMLREHFDTGLLLEVFEENPFLSKFYADRARYAFQTQMFFLLSRYRQQSQVSQTLGQAPLISDYMFAKDRLFAQLNLAGDEWEIYQQLHSALAEQIYRPDFILYLQADTDVLMTRIAQRDRPYERDMDRNYIEALRQAYDRYFADYQDTALLTIDTNDLNFVANPADFQKIVAHVRTALQEGAYQQQLPQFEDTVREKAGPGRGDTLADYQRFHVELDKNKGFITDLYFNYLCLSEEMGELGSALAELWREETRQAGEGQTGAMARAAALSARKGDLASELADCMAYLLKLANYAGIDLQAAYLTKMNINQERRWG
jgi:deoxyadenosine/deoxycytidine kinase/NTP pyrophosphatase (non-canonical NTP hydrolase)